MQLASDNWALIQQLPVAIYTCDLDGKIIFYNDAAVELWGRKPEIARDLWCGSWKIYRTDGTPLPLAECPMAITLKKLIAVKGEEIIVERPDGVRLHVLPHPKPIFDSNGEATGAINMLVDITDKKEKEQALRANQQKYKELSEHLEALVEERTLFLKKSEERYQKMITEVRDYAIILLDPDGNILNWNLGAEHIKGYSEQEILGRNFREFYLKEDRENKLPETLINRARETGRAMHEGWRMRKDGSKSWGSIVITALHNDNNEIIGFSKVTRDLTERKLAENQLKSYANDIEIRNKQLEEYAYVASHDLQEPLRKMQVFTELIEKHVDAREVVQKYLEKINKSAKRMSSLIKAILEYSQLSHFEELFVATDLNDIIENVKEDLMLLIQEKQATITCPNLPVIKGIPIQLHQLFSNLISNSLKFNNSKPLINIDVEKIQNVKLVNLPQLNPDFSYFKFSVRDNGCGFEPQYAEQVFKLFQRLDNNIRGTGIGLALCKKIVENHKGCITVTSERDKGTTFSLFLPIL